MADITEKQYQENTMEALRRMRLLIYKGMPEPTEKMFGAYAALREKPLSGLDTAAISAELNTALDSMQEVKKRVRKCYRESDIPPTLRMSLSGGRSMIIEKVLIAIEACKTLLGYMESGDTAKLAAAAELLEPMSTAAQAVLGTDEPASGCAQM